MNRPALCCAIAVTLLQAPLVRAQPDEASALVKRAIAKSQAGDHEGAIELFLAANRIKPKPILYSNIGSEYLQLNQPAEAITYFCKYLAEDPRGRNVEYASAQAKLAHEQLGRPAELDPCAPPPAPKPVKKEPVTPRVTPVERPKETPEGNGGRGVRRIGMSLVGIGVIGLGVGVGFGILAKRDNDVIEDHPIGDPWQLNIEEIEARGQRRENYQIAFMTAGGAFVAGGIVTYLLGRSNTDVAVSASAGGGRGAVTLSGRF
jgi:hypothetical protein